MSNVEKYYITNENESIIIDFLSKFFDPVGYRKTGRSTVLAKAFVVIAYNNPNVWIKILDHIPNQRNCKNTADKVRQLINYDYFKVREHEIKYVPIKQNEPLDKLLKK